MVAPRWRIVVVGWLLVGGAGTGKADAPISLAERWAAHRFDEVGPPLPESSVAATPGIEVLANHDPLQRNSRNGLPLRIYEREFIRGLYCHAPSVLVARLPSPGKKLTAVVGVDSRETNGNGSVVATVVVGTEQKFRSPLLRGAMEGVPVNVPLEGATEFQLQIDDGGDGIAYDQVNWADAVVDLEDGSRVWLGDLGESQPAAGPLGVQPFSFVYGGRHSAELLQHWQVTRTNRQLETGGTRRIVTWTDPQTKLQVRCEATTYGDFAAVDWTVWFRNGGQRDSLNIAQVQAMDLLVERPAMTDGDLVLHHATGTPVTSNDYQPHETTLADGAIERLRALNGRPCNHVLPYFNLAWGSGATGLPPVAAASNWAESGGVVAVLGWPGNWSAVFQRFGDDAARVRAGQGATNFVLHPGEEVRTPRAVLVFYDGDWVAGQNVWRRWMMTHNMPRPTGGLPAPSLTPCSSHQYAEMINANEENQKEFIDRYLEEELPIDYWWMDAGWYVQQQGWTQTGTWEVDRHRFPHGLRAVSDHAHDRGLKSIVWFEPERVAADTWLSHTHPEWIRGGAAGGLLNLGNPHAREWLVEHVDDLINHEGIDLYRQDFNIDPLPYWQAADAPDRQGISEIQHIEGYLAFWDELQRRHPDLLIDTCASGGCRNDLETMRRAVPLLRSDCILEPTAQQNHTYGISLWFPFYGTGVTGLDAYTIRSQMTPNLIGCWDLRDRTRDYDLLRQMLGEWKDWSANYYGDYYPLTPYAAGNDAWLAWQFHRPEVDAGMVQAFRRPDCSESALTVKLRGVRQDSTYEVRDLDEEQPIIKTGRELQEVGLVVRRANAPESAVIVYRATGVDP